MAAQGRAMPAASTLLPHSSIQTVGSVSVSDCGKRHCRDLLAEALGALAISPDTGLKLREEEEEEEAWIRRRRLSLSLQHLWSRIHQQTP